MKGLCRMLIGAVLCCSMAVSVCAEEPQWYQNVFKGNLTNAAGWKVLPSVLKGKMVGVYFSASWCRPCRGFTPQLVKFYRQVARSENFEIVFVSSDRNENDMMQYMRKNSMPWLAVPFQDPSGKALKRELGIRSIPTLAIYGSDGRLISSNARWDVVLLGTGAVKAWRSPNYKPRTPQDHQNSHGGKDAPSVRSAGRGPEYPAGGSGKDAYGWLKGPTEQWHTRMDTALKAAREEHKKLFILSTGSNWCGWCKKLYSDVLSSPDFLRLAKEKMVLVYMDFPSGNLMPERQKLYNKEVMKVMGGGGGFPTVCIADEQGRKIGKISGYRPLDKYMQTLQEILNSTPGGLPEWILKSPEQLQPMLERLQKEKRAAAAKAAEAAAALKGKISFEVTAWGTDPADVTRPFDSRKEIRVPASTRLCFRVKYAMPQDVKAYIYLRTRSTFSNGGKYASGNGEMICMLSSRRPCTQRNVQLYAQLIMPESRSFKAAEMPCFITWESTGNNQK